MSDTDFNRKEIVMFDFGVCGICKIREGLFFNEYEELVCEVCDTEVEFDDDISDDLIEELSKF